jgi:hypothetical protein
MKPTVVIRFLTLNTYSSSRGQASRLHSSVPQAAAGLSCTVSENTDLVSARRTEEDLEKTLSKDAGGANARDYAPNHYG